MISKAEVYRIAKKARRDFIDINKCVEGLVDYCVDASKFLSERLAAAGIEHEIISGIYYGDIDTWDIESKAMWEGIDEEEQRTHTWVWVPEVGYVDITVSQYHSKNPQMFVEGLGPNPIYMNNQTTPGERLYRAEREVRVRADKEVIKARLKERRTVRVRPYRRRHSR